MPIISDKERTARYIIFETFAKDDIYSEAPKRENEAKLEIRHSRSSYAVFSLDSSIGSLFPLP